MDKGVKIFLKFWDFEQKWLREFARYSRNLMLDTRCSSNRKKRVTLMTKLATVKHGGLFQGLVFQGFCDKLIALF